MQRKKLLIISRPLDTQFAGIHKYTWELINQLHETEGLDFDIFLIRSKKSEEFPKFNTIVIPEFGYIPLWSSYVLFVLIPFYCRKNNINLVLEPAHFGPFFLPKKIKRITVIHDLTPILFPKLHTISGSVLQKIFLPRILKKANLILSNSKNTEMDIYRYYPKAKGKTKTIYLGVSSMYVPTKKGAKDILKKYHIQTPYILFVGTIEPRKNLSSLLKTFEKLKRTQNIQQKLCIVGGRGWKTKRLYQILENHPFRSEIVLTGYVDLVDMPIIYSCADLLSYPSLYEGFGLPPIEAMACGTKAVIPFHSSLKELGGSFAFYYDDQVAVGLTKAILKTLSSKIDVDAQLQFIKEKFDWNNYKNEFLKVISPQVIFDHRIAIIVLNWNGSDDTIECLESILSLSYQNIEIHVIDNNSEQDERVKLTNFVKDNSLIKLHLYDTNFGFSKAHLKFYQQQIQKNEEIDYLVLINNDTIVEPDFIDELLYCAVNENATVVASKLISYYDRNRMDNAGHTMLRTGEILPIGNKKSVDLYNDNFETFGACAGGVMYCKKMLNEIGFFDPHFDTGYEDAELGLRAIIYGYKSIFCSKAIIYHKGGASIKKVFDENFVIRQQRNILYTICKHYNFFVMCLFLPLNLIRSIIALGFSLLFFKINFVRIIIKSWHQFFKYDFKKALSMKMDTKIKNQQKISFLKIFLKQESSIKFDFQRIVSYFIKNEKSALDKYR